jgi:Kef-type K+ transport system membrane component KefB
MHSKLKIIFLFIIAIFILSNTLFAETKSGEEDSITHKAAVLIFQLFVILICAKLAGEFVEGVLKQPAVLGEVAIGIVVGPYLLGSKIYIPGLGYLFPLPAGEIITKTPIPISTELWSVAQIGVVILLFLAGLETDKKRFFRYAGTGFIVAMGGVILPFFFGAGLYTLWFEKSFLSPTALFTGAIMTATSVGITARVLHDLGKIDSPEGVTILAAAVIDDVLGIIVLAIVVGIGEKGVVSPSGIALISVKAFGIWVILTAIALLLSRIISKAFLGLKTEGASLCMAIGLCFFAAVLCELFGLALVIGAYMVGLALSGTELDHHIQGRIRNISNFVTPIFFVTIGMLVSFKIMCILFLFGLAITFLAILGKVLGCGLLALFARFNLLGSARVGFGMLPRGEIALVIASVGLARNVIDQGIFGVAVMMTFITTLLAPAFLVMLFKKGGSGVLSKSSSSFSTLC